VLLEEKVAVVTGAAQGIGLGIAQRFAEHGAKVVLTDIEFEMGATATRELCAQGHDVIFVKMDVTDHGSICSALARCLSAHGWVDILVNNAGVNVGGHVVDLELPDWERVLNVNLTGAFLCSREFCRQMIRQGHGGHVLFVSSQAGKRGEVNGSAYCASKFGMLGLMQSLALEVARYGIRVNAICPGNVETPMVRWMFEAIAQREHTTPEEVRCRFEKLNPLGRLATPAEIGDVCAFLASSMAAYISGESINVDGGELSG
jgi:NAD(P)-dependent dehydrogenase (short-subunit alcohol dehydrogenase family)